MPALSTSSGRTRARLGIALLRALTDEEIWPHISEVDRRRAAVERIYRIADALTTVDVVITLDRAMTRSKHLLNAAVRLEKPLAVFETVWLCQCCTPSCAWAWNDPSCLACGRSRGAAELYWLMHQGGGTRRHPSSHDLGFFDRYATWDNRGAWIRIAVACHRELESWGPIRRGTRGRRSRKSCVEAWLRACRAAIDGDVPETSVALDVALERGLRYMENENWMGFNDFKRLHDP